MINYFKASVGAAFIFLLCASFGTVHPMVKFDADTKLLSAAQSGDIELALTAISSGAKLDCQDSQKLMPIHIAARNNRCDMIQLLLKSGVSVDAPDANLRSTALMHAAECGAFEALKLLVSAGANVDHINELGGMVPLHYALYYIKNQKFREDKFSPNNLDKAREYARYLFTLCKPFDKWPQHQINLLKDLIFPYGPDLIKKMLKRNIPVNEVQTYFESYYKKEKADDSVVTTVKTLNRACILGAHDFYDFSMRMQQQGESWSSTLERINIPDENGMTPLMWAAARGHANLSHRLLHWQANMSLVDEDGDTALSIARKNGQSWIVNQLCQRRLYYINALNTGEHLLKRLPSEILDKVMTFAGYGPKDDFKSPESTTESTTK